MNKKNIKSSHFQRTTCIKKRKVKADKTYKKQRDEYWENLFKNLEYEILSPNYKREDYLKELDEINKLLLLEEPQRLETLENVTSKSNMVEKTKPELKSKKCNPFINYLNKSLEEARIWRPKPPPDLQHKPLVEKSELITKNIVSEFCNWCKTLGANDENSVLTEKNILKMFEIWSNTFATKALCVSLQEMASVPTAVAEATNLPQKSERNVLHQQIMSDIIAESQQKHTVAFGTTLPPDRAIIPPKNHTYEKWIKNTHIKEELKTMEYVWKGITDFSSVHAYCKWLAANPSLIQPPYLKNLINQAFYDNDHSNTHPSSTLSTEYSKAISGRSTTDKQDSERISEISSDITDAL